MYSRDVDYGEFIVRENDTGNHLFVSAEGEFEIIVNDKVLGTLSAGKAFGELAILYNCRRTASIRGWIIQLIVMRIFSEISKKKKIKFQPSGQNVESGF